MKQRQKPVNKAEQLKKVISEGLIILRDRLNVFFCSTPDEYEQAKAKASPNDVVWLEEMTRATESDGKGAGFKDSLLTNGEDQGLTEVTGEAEINVQLIEAKELRNRSKDYLTNKLQEFAEQEKLALEVRKQSILWKRMNESL